MTTLSQIRTQAEDMDPEDAVEYLLGIIESAYPGAVDHPVDRWGAKFTPTERTLLCALYDRSPGMLSKEYLFDMLYSAKADGEVPGTKMVTVLICHIKKKLPACRGKIVNHPWRGYSFHKWDRERGYV